MGEIVIFNSEVVVLNVGTLYDSLISISVNLVGSFMTHINLPMEVSLVIIIILAEVVVCLQEFHLLGILAKVVILG